MNAAVLAAIAVGTACAALAAIVVRPTARLAPRLRPYTVVTRARVGRSADVVDPRGGARGAVGGVVVPPLRAAARTVGRLLQSQSDDELQLKLRQAGSFEVTAEDFRVRQVASAGALAITGCAVGALTRSPAVAVLLGVCGFVVGATRGRSRIERVIRERSERMRLELYTVNQLLALHLRTGAGPVQATQRVVDRGRGAIVDDLQLVLRSIRAGAGEGDAFRHAADTTPEPAAARTFQLFAAGTERGVDLGRALLDLSEDIRDARREELRKTATRRRAAMLLPTIAVLAPVMLLFIAAPIPFIVFGAR